MKNIAIILAGGLGNRLGGDTPKQFKLLNNRRVIDYSIRIFEEHDLIDKIIIVCHKDWVEIIESEYKEHVIVTGGASRQESSFKGLKACVGNPENVLIHDAARPFLTQKIISSSINSLDKYQAVNTCIPSKDTIIIQKNNLIESIPNRKNILLSQTPQSFKYKTILSAHNKFKGDDLSDDIQLVNKIDIDCCNNKGSRYNIKITDNLDMEIAQMIINNRKIVE